MKSMLSKSAALGFTILFTGLALFAAGQSEGEKGKAEDKRKALFEKACGGCHPLNVAMDQRKTKDQWQTVVASMIDKGAEIKKEDTDALSDYLAANFGIRQLAEDACSGCHPFADLVTEKRLSKGDWGNLVQSMVDRGAYLTKDQLPLVIEYLYKTYPDK